MNQTKKPVKTQQSKILRTFTTAALLTSGFFCFASPVLADGTTAGTAITNTANATYQDANNPGTTINSTSNPVTVTVAEVAGITVTSSGIVNSTPGATANTAGNLLVATYTVTNVGNSPTEFQIPNISTTTGPVTVSGVLPTDKTGATPANGQLQYSLDGGTTWINVPTTGLTTGSIPVGGTVLVRVPATVQAGAQSGDSIGIRLGQTPGDAQNQARIADGGDVYTVDPPNDTLGPPVNGVREASATQTTTVGGTSNVRALATVLKTLTNYNNSNTPSNLTDDILTYGLSLRVESTDVTNSGITPAALAGTTISVNGTSSAYILVSDAIPQYTQLYAAPTAPSGWQVVYTTSIVSTTTADQALWTTTLPSGGLAAVTRVGFINNPNVVSSVATGVTVTGFNIQVQTSLIPTSATTENINNIAQAFGKTAGNPTGPLVYDDSGDQVPDNYNSTTKTFPTSTTGDTGYYTGTIPAADTDTGNNNTGTNPGTNSSYPSGDVNVYTVQTPSSVSVLNGPLNYPAAIGPTSNNDDFTNKSALIPPNTLPGTTIDPAAVSFSNTIQNNSATGTGNETVTLAPTPPATAANLPNGTLVTISYQSQSATYTYSNGSFTLAANNTPISITGLAPNTTANYGVSVDLPSGTPLSTDTNVQRGFPVPVTATATNSSGTATNTTIDQVYTGFLQMVKMSQILQGTGPAVQGSDGTLSTSAKKPAPGNIIVYQIQYTNISTPPVGSNDVVLNASNVVITEDGTANAGSTGVIGTTGGTNVNSNNWALDNDGNGIIDTSNIVGTAKDSGTATITFYSGNPANTLLNTEQSGTTVNTDVTKYLDTITGQIAPGVSRTFTFQRKVN